MASIMQGDAYELPVTVRNDGVTVTADMVSAVEMVIGKITKNYPGDVTYSGGTFYFPITQEESFSMRAAPQDFQIRVKFTGGNVKGKKLVAVNVLESASKVVL